MILRHPYRKRKVHPLAILLILLALLISFFSFRDLFGARDLFSTIIYPFQFAALSVWNGVTGAPGFIGNIRSLSDQNDRMKVEIDSLRTRLAAQDELVRENERLRRELGFKNGSPFSYKLLYARIIGKNPAPLFSVIQIDRGRRAGVRVDRPVIAAAGLVGRVVEVSELNSKVMLITDADSSVAAVVAQSRDFGVVSGTQDDRLLMKYVSAAKTINPGDSVTTSSISTIFPPGLPIGRIRQAAKKEHDLFYHIEIDPAVDFSKIESVFVIL